MNKLCQTLWGQSDFEWEWVPAVNTAGGLLCIWNNNNFQVEVKTAERGFIMLEGVWLATSPQLHRPRMRPEASPQFATSRAHAQF